MATIVRPPGNSVAQPATGGQANRQVFMVHVIHIVPNLPQTPNTRPFENIVSLESENGVPGLGFDYPHLAAISGNFPFNPPVEGVERAHVISLRQYSSAEIPTSWFHRLRGQPTVPAAASDHCHSATRACRRSAANQSCTASIG